MASTVSVPPVSENEGDVRPSSETRIGVCFRLKEETPVILSEKATKKLKHCGKPAEPGKRTIEVVQKFPASLMNV